MDSGACLECIPATKDVSQLYNCAKFEAGKVEALRDIFDSYGVTPGDAGQMTEQMSVANKHLRKDQIKVVIREFAGKCPEWGTRGSGVGIIDMSLRRLEAMTRMM